MLNAKDTIAYLNILIGPDATLKIQEHLGGGNIYIPKPITQKNDRLITDYRNGISVSELAKKYGHTSRYIRHLILYDKRNKSNNPTSKS